MTARERIQTLLDKDTRRYAFFNPGAAAVIDADYRRFHFHGPRKSGVAHFAYDSEGECLMGVRKLLSYLPANNREKAPEIKYNRERQSFLYGVNKRMGKVSGINRIFSV